MLSFSYKIAHAIISAGLFTIAVFLAGTYTSLDPAFYLILIPLLLFLIFFGIFIGKRFSSPAQELLQEITLLRRGDVSRRLHTQSKDEFGQLAKAFNHIADALDHYQRQVALLDTKVALRTKNLEEIILALEEKARHRTMELDRALRQLDEMKQVSFEKQKELDRMRRQALSLSIKKKKK